MTNRNTSGKEVTSLPLMKGTILILVLLFIFLAILFFVLYKADLLRLPGFLERLFPAENTQSSEPEISPAFLSSLSGIPPAPDNSGEKLLSLSGSSLEDLLAAAKKPASIYQQFNVTWTAGDAYRSQQIYYVSVGSAERADVYENGELVKLVISDDGVLYVRDDSGEHRYEGAAADGSRFTLQSEVGLPSVAGIQKIIASAEPGSYTLTPSVWSRSSTITVTYTNPVSGTLESCEILPDCGAVVSEYSRYNSDELPFYYLSTDTILLSLGETGPDLFEIPEIQ